MDRSSPNSQLVKLQREGFDLLKAFHQQIIRSEFREKIKDDKLFAFFIDLTTSDYGISQAALARKIEMSPATITRWAKKQSLPAVITRGAVLDAVIEMVAAHVATQQQAAIPRREFAN